MARAVHCHGIVTERGTRRLMNDELARGQGTPKSWLGDQYPKGKMVRQTIAVHLLEYLSPLLTRPRVNREDGKPHPTPKVQDRQAPDIAPGQIPFEWKPPDLSSESAWNRTRIENLIHAAQRYVDPGPIIEEGMEILRRHRGNYDTNGPRPTHLQLVWWEFPEESWTEIREGSSMNFLEPPTTGITPNSELSPEQIVIAEEFIKELVELGVLV
jgi:hypothetical protein